MSDDDNNLFRSWVWTTIEEVTEGAIDQAPPERDRPFVYVDISSIDNRTKKIVGPKTLPVADAPTRARQRLKGYDVLVSMTRPNLNAVAILPPEFEGAVGSTGFHVLRTQWIDPAWLLYFVQTDIFVRAMSRLVQGVLYPAVRPKDIRSYRLPLAPLFEQRRIVAEIEKQFTRLEAGVAALKRVKANLKRYRAAVLKAAVEGRLVGTEAELARREGRSYEPASELLKRVLAERRAGWEADQIAGSVVGAGLRPAPTGSRAKNKEPVAPDAANLPKLPEGWAWATVDQLIVEPPCNGISVKGNDSPPGIAALKLHAMSDHGFDYSIVRYLPLEDGLAEDLWVREGDFFVSRGNGSLRLVGRGTSAQKPPSEVIFPDTMIRLRFTAEVRNSNWIPTIWPGDIIRRQVELRVKTTAGIYKISQPQVRSIEVPIPPLTEQHRIVAEVERRLSVIDELEMQVEANLKRAGRLRQAILKRAFEGKLVPQDPNDEPANVLLERIRAERAERRGRS